MATFKKCVYEALIVDDVVAALQKPNLGVDTAGVAWHGFDVALAPGLLIYILGRSSPYLLPSLHPVRARW